MRGISLNGNKKMSLGKLETYHKPKYIYIPLICGTDTDLTVLVKKGDYVCKGEMVARKKEPFSIPLYASVSGNVLNTEEHLYHNGTYIKCITIENDFQERMLEGYSSKKQMNEYTKEEWIEAVKTAGIVGMGGAGFPTYAKYQTQKPIKTLLINAVECEPYITADATLLLKKTEEILETIDAIMQIFKIEKGIIAVKKNNVDVIQVLNNLLGTYVHIDLKLVPNLYPMGWERTLVSTCTNLSYDKLPIECGIVVNNVSTIYAIHQAFKKGSPSISRMVTFTGDMLKQPTNILVKTGTSAKEVLEFLGLKRTKDIVMIAGGPMMGKSLPSDDLILTNDVNCVLVLKEQKDMIAKTCLRCGKCVNACPAKIAPVLIRDANLEYDALKHLDVQKCIECGICSYVCPAKIKVREYVRSAKETLRKGEQQ